MIIYKKEAAPSLGKTFGAVKYILEDEQKQFIIASPSLLLMKQTYQVIKSKGEESVFMISSEDNYIGGVCRRFEEAIRRREARVILITHSCLEESYKRDLSFEGWELIIDEVPNNFVAVSHFEQLVEDELSTIQNYVVCTDLTETPDKTKEIYRIKANADKLLTERLKHLRSGDNILKDEVLHMYEYLLMGGAIQRWQDKIRTEKATYYFLKVLNPLKFFSLFDKVTLLAANIDNTLVGSVWNLIFKISFQDNPDIRLRTNILPNTDRITIHYLLPEGRNMSKTLAESTTEDGEEVFDVLVNKGVSILESDFIYAVNTDRKHTKISGGTRVDIVCHGLNTYSNIHKAMLVYSCNPKPTILNVLKDLAIRFKLEENTFVNAFIVSSYLESSFQIATRVSIRNHSDTTPITIVVPDKRCAEYLTSTWFTNAKIVESLVDINVDDKRKNNGRKAGFQSELNMSRAEKSAFLRFKKQQGINFSINNSEHYRYVKEWLENKRRK
jgi:hypothetical protein